MRHRVYHTRFLNGRAMAADNRETRKGLYYALGCYAFWGMFPLYWYPLKGSPMDAAQIMAHRVLWSAVFAAVLLLVFRQGAAVWQALRRPKLLAMFAASALLIGSNWLLYLWAINSGHVLDASLGYFINPLFTVLLGCVFLREKLSSWQLLAVVLAIAGIVWLAWPAGHMPWIALGLALSFGGYSLVRKTAPMAALPGLALETLLLLPLALAYFAYCAANGSLVGLERLSVGQNAVLLASGAATTLPLLLFTAGARRISLSLLGILQYLSPTLQLLCGVFLFHEQLGGSRLQGYALVWAGVAVFLLAAWLPRRKPAA